MCKDCFIEAGSPTIENEAVIKAIELINVLYETEDGAVGGYGHIVFDDWNTEDENIDFCVRSANNNEHKEWTCEETRIASLNALIHFRTLTEDERYSALGKLIEH